MSRAPLSHETDALTGVFVDHPEREAVDEQHHVEPALLARRAERHFVRDHVVVLRQITEVDQTEWNVLRRPDILHRVVTSEERRQALVGRDKPL
jgi:hypothetical protein